LLRSILHESIPQPRGEGGGHRQFAPIERGLDRAAQLGGLQGILGERQVVIVSPRRSAY
jgi:hypothetical protein